MVLQVPQHAHCLVCGRAIQVDEKTCSDECKAAFERDQQRKKRTLLLLYAMVGLGMIVLVGQLIGGAK